MVIKCCQKRPQAQQAMMAKYEKIKALELWNNAKKEILNNHTQKWRQWRRLTRHASPPELDRDPDEMIPVKRTQTNSLTCKWHTDLRWHGELHWALSGLQACGEC